MIGHRAPAERNLKRTSEVNVGVNVAPQTLASAPRLVALPGSSVFHAPQEPCTLLAYAGR